MSRKVIRDLGGYGEVTLKDELGIVEVTVELLGRSFVLTDFQAPVGAGATSEGVTVIRVNGNSPKDA